MNSAPKIIPSNEFSQNIESDASKRHLKDATKDDLTLVSNVDSHNALIRYIVVPHGLFTGHREYRSIVGGLLIIAPPDVSFAANHVCKYFHSPCLSSSLVIC
jgi:hypothetical protein